jgi:hypothetical protein
MFPPFLNSHVEILTLKGMMVRGGVFRRLFLREWDLSPYLKQYPKGLVHTF